MSDEDQVPPETAEEISKYLGFAEARFRVWEQERLIDGHQLEALNAAYAQKNEQLANIVQYKLPLPDHLRVPKYFTSESRHPVVQMIRFELGITNDIRRFIDSGTIGLAQGHACIADAHERIAALKSRLATEGVSELAEGAPAVAPAGIESLVPGLTPLPPTPAQDSKPETRKSKPAPAATPAPPAPPRRKVLEILLDPRSLQYLMIFGGALLVLGLVIWLWAAGIFENKLVVAGAMGLGTLLLLGGGWSIIRFTRYQIAGQAITLLACLIMPLNLWFYHAQQIVTLEGHLWMAGVVCCALYAASAWFLRQPMFVYVLMAGITMTGMLILADETVSKLWEIAAPSTLLVILGLIALHVERAFAAEGPFSRQRFGMAFFWSGLVVLTSGLLLLLGAEFAGWIYDPYLRALGLMEKPEIADKKVLQVLALVMVLLGTYAYIYSDLVIRRIGVFLYMAVFTFLWAEVLTVRVLSLELTEEVAIIALAVTALIANLLQPRRATGSDVAASAPDNSTGQTPEPAFNYLSGSLARVGRPMGLFLCAVPVILGIELHLRATYRDLHDYWPFAIGWTYVIAMLSTALSARIGAYIYRHTKPILSELYFFATAAATLLAGRGLLAVLGVNTTELIAPWLMLIPIIYMIAARFYRGQTAAAPLMRVAQAAAAVLSVAVIGETFHLTLEHVFEPVRAANTNLLLAWFFAESALFYILAAAFDQRGFNVYFATASASAAIWQLLNFWQVPEEYYTLTFAIVGLLLLIGYRFAMLDNIKIKGITEPAFQSGNALLSLGFVSAILLTLSRLAPTNTVHFSLLFLLLALIVIGLAAAWLVREAHWRRWYIVTVIANGVLTFIVLNVLSELSIWEKMEIFSVAAGLLLLVVAHLGWYRESNHERHADWISTTLLLGSLLACAPLIIAVLIQRSHQTHGWTAFRSFNEIGILVVGLLLLGTGVVLKLKSTTIAGALTMVCYLLSLAFFIRLPEKLQTVAVYMMIGGGLFFGMAVGLSVYRDRLMALPGYIKRHEGVFRVLNWR